MSSDYPADAIGLDPEDPKVAASWGNQFGHQLYAELRSEDPEANVFFSPYSITTAFGMVQAGATGKAAEEISDAFGFPKTPSLHAGLGAVLGSLEATAEKGEATLRSANAMWIGEGLTPSPTYAATLVEHYAAGVPIALDFGGDAAGSAAAINGWVEDETAGVIDTLVDPGMFDGNTIAVLTNAIYFKGGWAQRFHAEHTATLPFTRLDGEEVEAAMMNQKAKFRMLRAETYQVLEMPYSEEDLSFVVFLPNEIDGLGAMEASVLGKAGTFHQDLLALSELSPSEVVVRFPKMKVDAEYALTESLGALGMTAPFTDGAFDDVIVGDNAEIYISDVVHRAAFELDEEGSEAAAATGVVLQKRSRPRVFECIADHPFLYAIIHQPSGAVLFLGACLDPAAGGGETPVL